MIFLESNRYDWNDADMIRAHIFDEAMARILKPTDYSMSIRWPALPLINRWDRQMKSAAAK